MSQTQERSKVTLTNELIDRMIKEHPDQRNALWITRYCLDELGVPLSQVSTSDNRPVEWIRERLNATRGVYVMVNQFGEAVDEMGKIIGLEDALSLAATHTGYPLKPLLWEDGCLDNAERTAVHILRLGLDLTEDQQHQLLVRRWPKLKGASERYRRQEIFRKARRDQTR